jgi:hypothetical protein
MVLEEDWMGAGMVVPHTLAMRGESAIIPLNTYNITT